MASYAGAAFHNKVLHEGGRAEEILNGDPITVCTACMEYADLCLGSSSSNGRFSDSGADMHGGGVRRARCPAPECSKCGALLVLAEDTPSHTPLHEASQRVA